MGSIEEKAEEKLDNLIQQTATLDAEPSGGAAAPAPPPSPPPKPQISWDYFKGPRRANKTQCLICERWYVDLEEHLTRGKSGCSKVFKKLGYDEDTEDLAPLESAIEPWLGAAVCGAVLGIFEDWLTVEHSKATQEWRDKIGRAYQQIAEERLGEVVSSPYLVLLVGYMELAIVYRDELRRKFKDKKLPDDPDASGASEMGPSAPGLRGDSGNREDFNGQGIS